MAVGNFLISSKPLPSGAKTRTAVNREEGAQGRSGVRRLLQVQIRCGSCVDHLDVITEILVMPERSIDAIALATWP